MNFDVYPKVKPFAPTFKGVETCCAPIQYGLRPTPTRRFMTIDMFDMKSNQRYIELADYEVICVLI